MVQIKLFKERTPDMEKFEQQVNKMLEEIFNENIPFRQAEDEDMCKYCDFKKICQR